MPTSFTLSYPADEFNLERCVRSGQVFRWRDLGDGSWLGVDGERWFHVRDLSGCYEVDTNASEENFRSLFQLDRDSKQITRAILDRGSELRPYMQSLHGLRITRQSDAWETLFSFLCTPNNHISRITRMVRKLAEYGEVIGECFGPIYRFPRADRIAAISEQELRDQGFGYRARSIPRAAKEILGKPDGWLESLKQADYEEAHRELCSLRGIGPKLADCIALFGLHHGRAVPIDTHMWQVATRLYFPEWQGKPLADKRYKEFGDFFRGRFGDLAGWAHQYLFYENVLNWRSRRPANV